MTRMGESLAAWARETKTLDIARLDIGLQHLSAVECSSRQHHQRRLFYTRQASKRYATSGIRLRPLLGLSGG